MPKAVVFPGQGSQSVGMLADIEAEYPLIRATFEEASDAISVDLWALSQDGPAELLAQTEHTQPVLLTSSIALWRLWHEVSEPGELSFVAGHSLGEFSALVAAGSMTLSDAARLVKRRGQLMEKAVPDGQGTMAAILGLDEDSIVACCEAIDGVVGPANFNAPGQIVIAGETPAVEAAANACKEAGAKRCAMLNVSGPFHSSLMSVARSGFSEALADLSIESPAIPIVQNVVARGVEGLEEIKDNLVRQIAEPVQWSQSVSWMVDNGIDTFIECGPGNVLSGLGRRIHKPSNHVPTGTLAAFQGLIES